MKGYMYILKCSDGSYYVGSTTNLELRLAQHQAGVGAKHTKKRLPVELVYYEEYARIDEAFYREKQVQKWRREKKEALIRGAFDELRHLSKNYSQLAASKSSTAMKLSMEKRKISPVAEPAAKAELIAKAELVEAKPVEAKLVEATDLKYYGNVDIINLPKTAFLCSRSIPASAVLKCYDWAIEQREKGNCVISGFHSQIEKDVLYYLLKGNQPIIIILARGLKKRIEPELKTPLEQGRILIVSPFDRNVKRVTERTAEIRNKMMIELADKITVGYASKGGKLEALLKTTTKEIIRLI